MDFDLLQRIRTYEMARVLPLMTPGQRVLEIGAGAGWQSQMMADYGMQVISVDLPQTFYKQLQEWLVVAYDGHRLPIKSHSVDVVFSSNVLEHIAHIEAFEAELLRVLKPGGKAIHVLPTTTWRFWTSVTHPLDRLSSKLEHLRDHSSEGSADVTPNEESGAAMNPASGGLGAKLRRVAFAPRHGEFGNTLTELYYFNQRRWRSHFDRTGWVVERCLPNGLFYTGYTLWSEHISMEARHALSHVLGASCLIYVLRPKPTA